MKTELIINIVIAIYFLVNGYMLKEFNRENQILRIGIVLFGFPVFVLYFIAIFIKDSLLFLDDYLCIRFFFMWKFSKKYDTIIPSHAVNVKRIMKNSKSYLVKYWGQKILDRYKLQNPNEVEEINL